MQERNLEYYKAKWEKRPVDGEEKQQSKDTNPKKSPNRLSPEVWDNIAVEWQKDFEADGAKTRRVNVRIHNTMEILQKHGFLNKDSDVIDIGCGPGRFVAEFAKIAHHATGTDFSSKMLEYGKKFAKDNDLTNTTFTQCDFKKFDLKDFDWEGKFDLVFSSMTPAIGTFEAVEKMIKMSRGYCCNTVAINTDSTLYSEIEALKPDKKPSFAKDGSFFNILMNLVWFMGYLPELYYYTYDICQKIPVTRDSIEGIIKKESLDEEYVDRLYENLLAKADADGNFENKGTYCYGLIVWDVRKTYYR